MTIQELKKDVKSLSEKEKDVCELCDGEGWGIISGCDHEGEYKEQEVRCECNPPSYLDEFNER